MQYDNVHKTHFDKILRYAMYIFLAIFVVGFLIKMI